MANGGHHDPKPVKKPAKAGKVSTAAKPKGKATGTSKPKGQS